MRARSAAGYRRELIQRPPHSIEVLERVCGDAPCPPPRGSNGNMLVVHEFHIWPVQRHGVSLPDCRGKIMKWCVSNKKE